MTYALEIQNLQKTYNDGFQALKGINMNVDQGDFFALLGPNGAGKSTTIGIITSLVRKTSGSVRVFAHDIDTSLSEAQTCIGVVPQEYNFGVYERVLDVVCNQAGFYGIPLKVAKPKAEYYLKKLELWDKRDKAAGTLSGGMKRRLMIARAMVHEPQLLILDEPTAGVDLEIRLAMWDFIEHINKTIGTTIILTTHYLEEAEQLCKNIAIINHGEVIEQTSMKSLLSRLDEEVIVLDIQGLQDNQLISLDHYSHKLIDKNSLEIAIKKEQSVTEAFVSLEQQGISVRSMRNKSNRLESLFLDLINQHKTIE